MSNARNQASLFCNQIKLRRFDNATLEILQSILISKDVQSLLELRSNLKEFLRSESVVAIREVSEEPVEHKLLNLEFLVDAFAIINDVEACENALSCLQMNGFPARNDCTKSLASVGAVDNIKRLKDVAMGLSATHPVHVQTAEYLKCKTMRSLNQTSMCTQGLHSASTSFRVGIKKRNDANLQRHRELQNHDKNGYQIT
ncbi:hypothetical protein Dimus_020509 [Dionaea muscipula]